MHDRDFHRMMPGLSPNQGFNNKYVPGSLSGSWEGALMVSPIQLTDGDFLCRAPLQCDITEHACFTPNVPVPTSFGFHDALDSHSSLDWTVTPHRLVHTEDGFNVPVGPSSVHRFCYEPLSVGVPSVSSSDHARRDPLRALDIVLTGETRAEHGEAWGAFAFSGRVRLADGMIILMRQPKDGDSDVDTWVFEGYLYSGISFIGRWRSSKLARRQGTEGIFSLTRKALVSVDVSAEL